MLARAQINSYNDRETAELSLIDYRPSGFNQDRFFAAAHVYEALSRGEGCDKRLKPRVIPNSREELMKIYDLVRKYNGVRTPEDIAVFNGSVNYCMLRITLDAFAQAGMIEYVNGAPKPAPVSGKRDLFQSGLLAELMKQF